MYYFNTVRYHHCFLIIEQFIIKFPFLTIRCTRSGLKQITCPSGLAFDIDKQTCDWKGKVTNCDKLESKSHFKKTKKQKRSGVGTPGVEVFFS